jgi:glycosyltransferase involved in cell wall biosynthesis
MKSPRILVAIDLFPPIVGGAETHARDLVDALRALQLPVTVLTRWARPDLAREEILPNGARILRVPAAFGGVRFAQYGVIPSFLRTLRREKDSYDLIYLCGFRVLGWPLVGLARRLGKPIVLRAEVCGEASGAFIWDKPGRGTRPALRHLFSPLIALRNRRLRRADSFLSISRVIRDEYLDSTFPEARIADIPNGIDLQRFTPVSPEQVPSLRRELGLPAQEPVFVYSGKLNRGKGLELLLSVWKSYVADGRPGHLLLVGAGGGQSLSCESELNAFVSTHALSSRVTFSGYRNDVERWLQASDIFVFPSEAESFGLAPLEANACGLPALCTPAGALAETAPDGEAGLAFPVGDAVALRRAMDRLVDDPALRLELGRRALERVRRLYSFCSVAALHLRLFQDLTP